ncbi:MAG: hypothetical protein FD128_845 [Hyphomonadaceae bacterium]|nr:MAG: hypothetical protein FD128_845 [Hyphomonadaceae bacterium]
MANDDVIIKIENVTKRYGKVAAVDNVSLEIKRGEFFALCFNPMRFFPI